MLLKIKTQIYADHFFLSTQAQVGYMPGVLVGVAYSVAMPLPHSLKPYELPFFVVQLYVPTHIQEQLQRITVNLLAFTDVAVVASFAHSFN